MIQEKFSFSSSATTCYFDASFDALDHIAAGATMVLVTDENIFRAHQELFVNRKVIVIRAGEQFKVQSTIDHLIQELIRHEADRKYMLVGVGGGVITDLTGYASAVYMRGLRFGFVPVSILAMVDASIGGKNGIDVGPYKNLVGTIRQPEFLLYDTSLLHTLPHDEWVNGFAEIIKHACIRDAALFDELRKNDLAHYKNNKQALDALISRNARIKASVVSQDEFEKGERRLLNFGHTWGHAIETKLNIPHGHAVAIGMVMAARLSEKLTGFQSTQQLIDVLQQYELPVQVAVDHDAVFSVLKMDKKKDSTNMNYVLLNKIGEAIVQKIPIEELEKLIKQCK